jgi:biotin carboxyl carrier protein
MRYYATLNGRERTVDLESLGGDLFKVSIDGAPPHTVDATRLEGSVISLLNGNRSHEVDVEEDGEALNLLVSEQVLRVELVDERKKRLQPAKGAGGAEGRFVLRAPMPGKVVKVLVAVGAEVAEGQGLVIIEAMKMENELRSPRKGKVTGVTVQEGQTVEGKALLITVE